MYEKRKTMKKRAAGRKRFSAAAALSSFALVYLTLLRLFQTGFLALRSSSPVAERSCT